MTDRDTARAQMEKLIRRFASLSEKERRALNEANTRKDFIMPMLLCGIA
jgi:hypothetical protein